jgi:hypothetical protein
MVVEGKRMWNEGVRSNENILSTKNPKEESAGTLLECNNTGVFMRG